MNILLSVAFAAAVCFGQTAAAQDMPTHDPAIERAAIDILQKKLPDMRGGYGVTDTPHLTGAPPRGADGFAALLEIGRPKTPKGRIIWL